MICVEFNKNEWRDGENGNTSDDQITALKEQFSQFYVNRKLPNQYYSSNNLLLRNDRIFDGILEETGRETLRITLEIQHKDHKEINKQFQATLMNYYLESYVSPLLISHMGLVYKREVFREMKQLAERNMKEKQKKYIVLMNIYCQKIIESGQQEEYVNILYEAILKPSPNQNTTQLEYCTYYRQRLCALILLQHYYTKKRDTKYQNFYCFWHELFEDKFPILQYIMDDKQLRKRLRMNTGIRVQAVPSLRNYVYQRIGTSKDEKGNEESPKIVNENMEEEMQNENVNLNMENQSEEKIFKMLLDNKKSGKKIELKQQTTGSASGDKKESPSKKHQRFNKIQEKNISQFESKVSNHTHLNYLNNNTAGQKYKNCNTSTNSQNEKEVINVSRVESDQKMQEGTGQQLEKQVLEIIQNKALHPSEKVEQLQMVMMIGQQEPSSSLDGKVLEIKEQQIIAEETQDHKSSKGGKNTEKNPRQDQANCKNVLLQRQIENQENQNAAEALSSLQKLANKSKPRCSIEAGIQGEKLGMEQEEEEDKSSGNIKSLSSVLASSSTSIIPSAVLISQLNLSGLPQSERNVNYQGNTISDRDLQIKQEDQAISEKSKLLIDDDAFTVRNEKTQRKSRSERFIRTDQQASAVALEDQKMMESAGMKGDIQSSKVDEKSKLDELNQSSNDKSQHQSINKQRNIIITNNVNSLHFELEKTGFSDESALKNLSSNIRMQEGHNAMFNQSGSHMMQQPQPFTNSNLNLTYKRKYPTIANSIPLNSPQNPRQIYTSSENSFLLTQDRNANTDIIKQSDLGMNYSSFYQDQNNIMNKQMTPQMLPMSMNMMPSHYSQASPLMSAQQQSQQQMQPQLSSNLIQTPYPSHQLIAQQQSITDPFMFSDNAIKLTQSVPNPTTNSIFMSNFGGNGTSSMMEQAQPSSIFNMQQNQQQRMFSSMMQAQISSNDLNESYLLQKQFAASRFGSTDSSSNNLLMSTLKSQVENNLSTFYSSALFNQQNGNNTNTNIVSQPSNNMNMNNCNVNKETNYYANKSLLHADENKINSAQDFSLLKRFIDQQGEPIAFQSAQDLQQGKKIQKNKNRECDIRFLEPYERAYMPENKKLIVVQTIQN